MKESTEAVDLQEIKKANDLASLKLEVCSELFEMLINEIKTELFPIRSKFEIEEQEQPVLVPVKPEKEGIKQIRIDEKQINYKKTPKPDKPATV